MRASLLKSIGYLVSIVSVILLGAVAWQSTADDPGMRMMLIGGMTASIAGMLLRWLSYQAQEKEEGNSRSFTSSGAGKI